MTDTIDVTTEVAALAEAAHRLGVHIHKTTFNLDELVAWVAAMESTGYGVERESTETVLRASIPFERGARLTVTYLGDVETREVTTTTVQAVWPEVA